MKGPFGLLLIGGGIILIIGLFTGKITLPGGATASGPGVITGTVPGSVNPNPPPSVIQIGKQGSCPTGYHLQRLGSVTVCVKD